MKSFMEQIVDGFNRSTEKQSKPFGTYDFETYDWTKPLCADAYCPVGENAFQHAYSIDREDPVTVVRNLLFELEASEVNEWWAHNGGKYDALFMVDVVKQLKGWKCDGAVAAGRIINLRVMSPHSTFVLKDSYAVIQSSLDKALESFQISHKKVFTKDDYKAINEDKRGMRMFSDEKLKLGCQADTEALHALICKARDLFEEWGGSLKSTFSASALSVVRAQVGKPLATHEGNQWANDIGKKAYCGGRVEIFKHSPDFFLNEVDVTSSYPWSMSKKLPWHLIGWDKPDLYSDSKEQLVYARVNVPEQYVPPLPYVPPSGGLFFPWGEWSGWFTSAELRYAIEYCNVDALLHEAVSYTSEQPFESFIQTVFTEKQISIGARREFCKLVLNGCYGKFAQKPENTRLLMFDSAEQGLKWAREHANKQPEPLSASNTAWSFKTFRWPKQTHYALASFITGYSRILLHKHLIHAGTGLSYCDTDSVHGSRLTDWRPFINDKLGGLKLELEQYIARFYAPKLYELHPRADNADASQYMRPVNKGDHNAHYASKGFPVDAESFRRIVEGERVGNKLGRMQLLKTQLRKDSGVRHLGEDETRKQWSGRSNKRFAIPNSPTGDTKPWHVRELHEGAHEQQQSPIAPVRPVGPKARRR